MGALTLASLAAAARLARPCSKRPAMETEMAARTLPYQVTVRREVTHIRTSAFGLLRASRGRWSGNGREVSPMKRLMISSLVSLALFAATTAMQRSPSMEPVIRTAANSSIVASSDCATVQPPRWRNGEGKNRLHYSCPSHARHWCRWSERSMAMHLKLGWAACPGIAIHFSQGFGRTHPLSMRSVFLTALPGRPKQSSSVARDPLRLTCGLLQSQNPEASVCRIEIAAAGQAYQLLRMRFVACETAAILQRHRALMPALGARGSIRRKLRGDNFARNHPSSPSPPARPFTVHIKRETSEACCLILMAGCVVKSSRRSWQERTLGSNFKSVLMQDGRANKRLACSEIRRVFGWRHRVELPLYRCSSCSGFSVAALCGHHAGRGLWATSVRQGPAWPLPALGVVCTAMCLGSQSDQRPLPSSILLW